MDAEENPVPTDARHKALGPAAGQLVRILSEETPLRFGPRHCGQSAPGETDTARSEAVPTTKLSFIK